LKNGDHAESHSPFFRGFLFIYSSFTLLLSLACPRIPQSRLLPMRRAWRAPALKSPSGAMLHQQALDMSDGFGRIESFRAYVDTIHDAMAAEYAESVIQLLQARSLLGVAAVNQEPV
jgi:hypothetical protein